VPGKAPTIQAVVDLRPAAYQSSVNAFRTLLETPSSAPLLFIGVRTPRGEMVELQMHHEDAYVAGFKGADGWYFFDGEKGPVLGQSCGTGSNYNQLGRVGRITYDDLNNLDRLSTFRKGLVLDKRLCAIAIALTSEAARFATVATYFTGLTNSVGTAYSAYLQGGVDFEYLKSNYFNQWAKPPEVKMEPGKVYHFVRGEILLPRNR
jgi:hypothetical protein